MKSLLFLLALAATSTAQPRPLQLMLVTGGCCHDYKTQSQLLKQGIEERILAEVVSIHVDDHSNKPALPIHGNPDYAAGYDVVIHDQCAARIEDLKIIAGVLHPHQNGIPAVALHCAMHSYRTGNFQQQVEPSAENGKWFELLGLQSVSHGPQQPIRISYTAKQHPITQGLVDWTTTDEELYNNVAVHATAEPLARGQQGQEETVVAWTNLYGPKKTRVFGTTIGHNNQTVADPRYLDLLCRGILWSAGKLGDDGKPTPGFARTLP
jgi:type 1 glutamine amidotransferase